MKFDELKKVWDNQNNKPMYAIDHNTLENIVVSKKRSAINKAKFMEYVLIGANTIAGMTIIIAHYIKEKDIVLDLVLAAIMLITATVLLFFRSQRISNKNKYERSINGDLEHGLSDALYVVRTSKIMQYYFAFIAIIAIFSKGFESLTFTLVLIVVFAISLYASSWEHKWYVNKLKELKELKRVLTEEKED